MKIISIISEKGKIANLSTLLLTQIVLYAFTVNKGNISPEFPDPEHKFKITKRILKKYRSMFAFLSSQHQK
jgi:hypothetical protein